MGAAIELDPAQGLEHFVDTYSAGGWKYVQVDHSQP